MPGADPATSNTLPGKAYTDATFLDLEIRELFHKTWHYAGWIGDLQDTGSYITASLMDQNVIIIRNRQGTLAGFHNVCQHRAHELLNGKGRVTSITCPYHAWTYNLEGNLKRARGSETTGDFDTGSIALKPVKIEVIADKFVFFNLDMDADPYAPQIESFLNDLRAEIPDFDSLMRVEPNPIPSGGYNPLGGMYPIRANWKVVMENFLECYHCRGTHPGFTADLTLDDLTYEGHENWAKQKSGTRRENHGNVIFWTLFPNLTLGFASGEPSALFLLEFAVPKGPESTQPGNLDYYRLPGDEDGRSLQPDWGPLGLEDKRLCESVQRGLHSIGYGQGRYIYDPDNGEVTEEAVHAFNRFVLTRMNLT
tara:strand:+ start:2041 stop:3138 length:1098 start_codon:yes stop_codon:yes gene_type:complete